MRHARHPLESLREPLLMRGAVLATLTGIFCFAVFIPINLVRGLEQVAWANVIAIALFLLNLLLLLRHRRTRVAAALAILVVMGWLFFSLVPSGVEVFFWMFVLPWVVFFFFGLRGGLVWTLGLVGYFLALLLVLPLELRHAFVPYVVVLSFLAVSGLAAIYEHLTNIYRRRIEEVSHRDPLTGVWNRRKFSEVVQVEIARARRYGRSLSLLMLDIDGFKQVNDSLGHWAGDRVLEAVAESIQAQLRQSDYLFRWGGDEFVVLATETGLTASAPSTAAAGPPAELGGERSPSGAGAHSLARKIGLASVALGPDSEPLALTIGLAELGPDDTEESLIRRADDDLYAAKRRRSDLGRRAGPQP